MQQSWKVLWVVLSSLFYKQIWKNGRRGHGLMFASARWKESNKSRFDSYSVRNSVLIISHITFRDCRVHIFSDHLSRNSRLKILFALMQINPLFKLGRILDVSVFSSWKLTYPLKPRSWGSLLPVPTERERQVGENLGTRMLSPSCLFNGYKGSCDKNFLSKTTSSPYFLRYVISSREAISRVLAYFAPVLEVYFIRVGNALQKGINHQNYNDSVFVGRTSERVLLLLQMQWIFFAQELAEWLVSAEHNATESPLCFWRKQELDTDFATVARFSSLWLQ